jgi:glucan phosphoethanolaminetransferase (alkaline phosphatase superfamily)
VPETTEPHYGDAVYGAPRREVVRGLPKGARGSPERRRSRRRRRLLGAATLCAPGVWIVGTDVLRRSDHLATFDRLHVYAYAATAVISLIFWAVLLYVAARGRGWLRQLGAGLFATLFTLSVGVQAAFFGFYDIYLSHDCQIYARSLPALLIGYLPLHQPLVLLRLLGHCLVGLALLAVARVLVRPRPRLRTFAPLLLPGVFYGVGQVPASYRQWQSTTPDLIYMHGIISHVQVRRRVSEDAAELRVQRRDPAPLPPLVAQPRRQRNVLFILQESLRHDVSCNRYVPGADATTPPLCATPASNRAAPKRFALEQLRASASTTAISISNLWSGVPAYSPYDEILSAPLLWEYADAAGYDSSYWTSQHVMFGSMRLYVQDLPARHRAYATHLDKHANFDAGALDAYLTDWAIDHWHELEEPFFAVVHYSNVHFPYVYDEAHAPFQPAAFTKAPEKQDEYLNYYRNVAYLSDLAVGRLIEHVRQSDSGARTVIVYTSDHGESFREHWQLGHTSAIYDEEIKVPGWIDAPPGTLAPEEEASLRAAEQQFVWHYDLGATVLDLVGVWDAPEIRPFRARMIGHPLTRPERTTGPVPLSNCSWVWECGFRNWGLMQGHMKIEARAWDGEFHCFDLLADPYELENLGEDACAPLPDIARATFGAMPVEDWPIGKDLVYGPPAPPATAAAATE